MHDIDRIDAFVEAKRANLEALSDRIFDSPEIAYQERRSVAEHAAVLEREGFRIVANPAGIATAVIGEAGAGGPVVAFLGEYDALPGLSQASGVAELQPLPGDGMGHGCGHNLLGAGALLAAVAVKDWLLATGTPGRVRYYGCPAEEGGAAKTYLVRAGAFADVDVGITWHSMPLCGVNDARSLANTRIDFTFTGRASHAAAAPHLGRSALDAVELTNVAVNYLREHMPSTARIHYAYIDAGGVAPNVVQARATIRYAVRAADLAEMRSLLARVRKCADGAALMTETKLEARVLSAVSNLLGNAPLERAMQANWEHFGPPEWDAADRAFAEQIRATLGDEDLRAPYRRAGLAFRADQPLADEIVPLGSVGEALLGSTDVGDVSWVAPLVQADGPTVAVGTAFHTWQFTAHGKTALAKKGMAQTAKVMAATALDCFADPALVKAARADLEARTAGSPYVCPIPPEVMPPGVAA